MLVNQAYEAYVADPSEINKEQLGKCVFTFCDAWIEKKYCPDAATRELLQDAVMETCRTVWETLPKFDASKGRKFASWIRMILDSDIKNQFRNYKTRNEVALHPGHREYSNAAARIEAKLTLKQLVSTLFKEDQAFVKLKLEGVSETEIAVAFNHDVQWTKDRFRAIKKQMREAAK